MLIRGSGKWKIQTDVYVLVSLIVKRTSDRPVTDYLVRTNAGHGARLEGKIHIATQPPAAPAAACIALSPILTK
jgi:hypothetical protein